MDPRGIPRGRRGKAMHNKDFMTIALTLQALTQALQTVSDTPRLDAELLIAHALNQPRSFLYAYPEQLLSTELQQTIIDFMTRRLQGEPLAYIMQQKEFWSLNFIVSRDTLIPRPETEHLIEWALNHLPNDDITIADLGTGSGAIAIALAHVRPTWRVHATDSSLAALAVAIKNSQQHKLTNIEFYSGHWCDALPHNQYTAIISNPPYIADDDPHLGHLTFEPRSALSAHDNGFADFKIIIEQAKNYLQPHGLLVLEHGYNQAPILVQLLHDAGFRHVHSHCDLAEKTRFVSGIYE